MLLACVPPKSSAEALQAAFGLIEDWDRLLEVARLHGMLYLLYRGLLEACPDAVPAPFLEELHRLYCVNGDRNLRTSAWLLRILDALEKAGVRAASFKGPLLAEYAYGDLGMRFVGDLDILVAEEDIERARGVLHEQGYEPMWYEDNPAVARERFHLILRDRRRRGPLVELHWRTGPAFVRPALSAEDLLDRTRPTSLLGRSVQSLDPVDLLMLLSIHGSAHCWKRLEMIAGLAGVVAKGGFGDLVQLIGKAGSRGCLRRCLVGAALVRDVGGAVLPPVLEAALVADPVALRLSREVLRIVAESEGRETEHTPFKQILWRARTLDTRAAGVRNIILHYSAPRDEDARLVTLPPRLAWLYYAVRPVRIAASLLLHRA